MENKDYARGKVWAQVMANNSGFDYGIEKNPIFGTYSAFMLPRKINRSGHELRCEIVTCSDINRMQTGHGSK